MRRFLIGAIGLAAVAAVVLLNQPTQAAPAPIESVPEVESVFHDRHVEVDGPDGYIAQAILTQQPRTTGRSPDVIRVYFDEPVTIRGAAISVDISGHIHLVEVSVGVGWDRYEVNTGGAIFHTSYAETDGGQIDEQIWFEGGGIPVEAGEWVAVTAWLQNTAESVQGVSPEVILWYD